MMNFKTRCYYWPWFRFPAEFQKKSYFGKNNSKISGPRRQLHHWGKRLEKLYAISLRNN